MVQLSKPQIIVGAVVIIAVIVTSAIVFMSLNPPANTITLYTTTSTQDSGLLDYLDPIIKQDTGITINVVAVGTGQALKAGTEGLADVVMVHARSLEDQFIASGYGIHRVSLMHDDFILVGPQSDPAHIMNMTNAILAFQTLYNDRNVTGVKFVSRGDNSGTYVRELQLWNKSVNINFNDSTWINANKNWYIDADTGMANTLTTASQEQAYTLTDRPTYLQINGTTSLNLVIEAQNPINDTNWQNQYGVILVNPDKFSSGVIKFDIAKRYVQWLISDTGQKAIADYHINGKQVFFTDFASFETTMPTSELSFWGLS